MKSHKSKARLSLNNPKVMLKQSNLNSSFHEKYTHQFTNLLFYLLFFNKTIYFRFNFETNKNIQKDVKAFHFSRPTDKGDILYKLLKSILNSDDPDFHSSQNLIKDGNKTKLCLVIFIVFLNVNAVLTFQKTAMEVISSLKKMNSFYI